MQIQDKAFVAIEYSMALDSGQVVDETAPGKPLTYIHNTGQMLPGVESNLEGLGANQSIQFTVEAEEGFGQPRDELLRPVPRDRFPEGADIRPGMAFQSVGPDGQMTFVVKEVDGDTITVDLNHPLCGERLHFDVRVVEVRQATRDELAAV